MAYHMHMASPSHMQIPLACSTFELGVAVKFLALPSGVAYHAPCVLLWLSHVVGPVHCSFWCYG